MKLNIEKARMSSQDLGIGNYCAVALGSGDLAEAFHVWAFGSDIKGCNLSKYPTEWNKRHSDLFLVGGRDHALDSLDKMMKSFVEITIEKSN